MARSNFFRSPIETTARRSSTAQKLVRERFWIFADSIILVLFDVVEQKWADFLSSESLYSRNLVALAKEKEEKESHRRAICVR
jgi:hypothetical protein